MNMTPDAIAREKQLIGDTASLKDFFKGFGLSIQLHPDMVSVDGTTAVARTVADNLSLLARSLRRVDHTSRINVISEGFSRLGGQADWEAAFGVTAQTRGFVDLNGDGLPDYVLTEDRDQAGDPGSCAGRYMESILEYKGTSSITAGRAFLPTPECVRVPSAPTVVTDNGYATLPLNVDIMKRDGTAGTVIDTRSASFVTLADMNSDGRPDIVIAGDTSDPDSTGETWQVFLNNGRGFDLDSSHQLAITSPRRGEDLSVEPSFCTHPDIIHGCLRVPVDVPFPSIRTTHSFRHHATSQYHRNTSRDD